MCKARWQEGRRPQVAPRTGLSRELAPGQQVLRSGTGPGRTPPTGEAWRQDQATAPPLPGRGSWWVVPSL